MSRILFSHSYFQKFDPKQVEIGQPYAPLATITAAAVMRDAGHQVSLFDTMFASGPEALNLLQEGVRPDYFVLYDDGFNYLTKMCLTNMRDAAYEMIRMAKQEKIRVIISSSDATDNFETYLQKGVDFVIIGEAELTLQELIQALDSGSDFGGIPGLAFLQEGAATKTLPRKVMVGLDALPLPAWDLVHLDDYRNIWNERMGYFSINIATTRGCPYKCNWCAKPIYGNRYNSRSPEHVMKEIRFLKEQYGFDHIWFCDDIFGLKPGWVAEFSLLLKQETLSFRYKIQSRSDLLIQDNYVKALAISGCETVWMGAESGSQKILDAMDKGTTVEQIVESTRLLKQYGIKPAFFLQFGYPGESREDIDATIRLVNQLLPDDIGISVSYPLPGTKFHEQVKGELKEKANWTDSHDLSLMFRNTFPPGFYKQLHRYVHKNYRKHQGFESMKKLFTGLNSVDMKTLYRAASVIYYIPSTMLEKRRLKIAMNSVK
jgi:anaerobic magnesium-protoporphyrin IX monomethyl ester cyclase